MTGQKVYRAIGLMSGTSLDGVDAALIETDGRGHVKPLSFISMPYDARVKTKVRACFGLRDPEDSQVAEAARLLTFRHVDAVMALIDKAGADADDIDVIGFHGQTITHDPKGRFTLQIGDGETLAEETGIDVVNDFRSADMTAGGEGAPFLPLYHLARAGGDNIARPLAVLNIGGVANVTWIGEELEDLLAFDTGPGSALIDDFVFEKADKNFDEGGELARAGTVDRTLLERWMALPYFALPVPKSLDRNSWDVSDAEYLSLEDGAATLTAFTVEAIRQGARKLPGKPDQWLVTGGGRHNSFMLEKLREALDCPVKPVDALGWNGDSMEAEGFAYLAVRSLLGEPLSVPGTTGVPKPMTGGVLHRTG